MATSKIQKVSFLSACIAYCIRNSKTNYGQFISTHNCTVEFAARDFENINLIRQQKNSKPWSVKSYMIIQSFKPGEVSAEKAHEIGKALAQRYLNNDHQYIVTTHIDRDHIHNHIVFNATNFSSLKSFDSKTKHLIDDLRNLNDEICLENGLSVIKNPMKKGVSLKEYYARKHSRSYKAKLEIMIDQAILESNSWDDFLKIISKDCDIKFGKYIAFKQKDQVKFTRSKSLGIDYSEESIKYRIEHKELETERPLIDLSLIEKSELKGGLRYWATMENIKKLTHAGNLAHQNQITYQELLDKIHKLNDSIATKAAQIDQIDAALYKLYELLEAAKVYKSSYDLISGYKSSLDKAEYKRKNYAAFKAYDKAKAILSQNKNSDGKVPSIETIQERIVNLKIERDIEYTHYQNLKSELAKMSYSPSLKSDQKKEKRISK